MLSIFQNMECAILIPQSSSRNHRHRRQGRHHADSAGAAEMLVQKDASKQNSNRGIE
jgi:hypothetical protein